MPLPYLKYVLLLVLAASFTRLPAQTPAEITWLNQHAQPIGHLTAGNGFADLAPLAAVVAPARVVGLGECTHGTHEVFQLKHRLLEYLVTQQGFTTFAIEADYGWGEILNEYIQTGKGDSLTVHSATGFEFWNTTEFWDMVEWMRAYNQQHAVKLHYVGIDMQDPYPNLFSLDQYAQQQADTVLRRRVRVLRSQYFAMRDKWTVRGKQPPSAIKQLVKRLSDELAHYLETAAAPAVQQHHACVLVQKANMIQNGLFHPLGRDEAMAENVGWVLQQDPTARVVLWAHNGHIMRDSHHQSMGYFLAQQFGVAYVPIGFATGIGTASTNSFAAPLIQIPLQAPVAGSFEAWLDQASASNYLLPLLATGATPPEAQWLDQRRQFRSIGALASTSGQGQFRWHRPLPELFDALFYLHATTASQSYRAAHPKK
ncbi:MAG: erythromycin esterase family protein [Janthinobacterium lividum]